MKKAMINYWVDMIIGIAFLFCAVTGLFRLFPEATVSVSSSGQPVILGISTAVWQTIHDWSGFIMTAGVGVHTALHFKWLVSMTGKVARGKGRAAKSRVTAPRTKPVAAPQGVRGQEWAAQGHVQTEVVDVEARPVAGTPDHDLTTSAEGSLARLESMGRGLQPAASSSSRSPLYTRKRFLVAAGVVGAAAFAAGCGLLSDSDTTSPTTGSGSGGGADESWDDDDGADSGAGTGASTSSARVVVDADACTGCGNCLQVCPDGVFSLSGGKSVVQNADACRLCGHCVRSCAPAAITLNA